MLGWEIEEHTFRNLTQVNEWLADNPEFEPMSIVPVPGRHFELGFTEGTYNLFAKKRISD